MGRWLCLVFSALCLSGLTVAQEASLPQTVPTELLQRLLGKDAQIVVGQLPDDIPVALTLPPTLQVDAAVTRDWPGSKSVQVYLSSSLGRARSETLLKARLEAAGLTPFTPPAEAYGWGWGFVDQNVAAATPPTLFCGPNAYAELSTEEGSGGAQLTLSLNERTRQFNAYTVCDEEAYAFRPYDAPPLPPLAPPEGATVRGIEGGSVFSAQTSSVALETSLTAEQVAAHYRDLLTADWRLQASGGDDALGYSQWLGQDEAGQAWYVVLLVMGPALYPGQVTGTLLAVPVPDGTHTTPP